MKLAPGVTCAIKKDGTTYYRSSITIKKRHVSLGSFANAENAAKAYQEASSIIRKGAYTIEDYNSSFSLDFFKFVILLNYRNNGIYFKTPIYLQSSFFYYYLSPERYLIFDREDLFFYANHKLQIRGGYYFICDYGSQYSILSRYGIKRYAKKGIDYIFVNQNEDDFRYENIKVINDYMGVTMIQKEKQTLYECRIHIRGNTLVGRYTSKQEAAIAYNKAVDILKTAGSQKRYIKNYIPELSSAEYHTIYASLPVSPKLFQTSIEEKN